MKEMVGVFYVEFEDGLDFFKCSIVEQRLSQHALWYRLIFCESISLISNRLINKGQIERRVDKAKITDLSKIEKNEKGIELRLVRGGGGVRN